jgi:hypothetical protein
LSATSRRAGSLSIYLMHIRSVLLNTTPKIWVFLSKASEWPGRLSLNLLVRGPLRGVCKILFQAACSLHYIIWQVRRFRNVGTAEMLQQDLFTWRQKHVHLARDRPTAVEVPLHTTKPGRTAVRRCTVWEVSRRSRLHCTHCLAVLRQKNMGHVFRGARNEESLTAGKSQQHLTKQSLFSSEPARSSQSVSHCSGCPSLTGGTGLC